MGNVHDMSGFDRESMIVEFTELATEGLQTPQPLWMQRDNLPDWAKQTKENWLAFEHSDDKLSGKREERLDNMKEALVESAPTKKAK